MILENLDVWITTDSQRLVEYGRVRSSKDTVECWIQSTEGKNFAINLDFVKHPKRARLGLLARPFLDGIDINHTLLWAPTHISKGYAASWGAVTTKEGKRRFVFGKLQTTDHESLVPLDNSTEAALNTIKIKLNWIRGCKQVYESPEKSKPKTNQKRARDDTGSKSNARLVHEQLLKTGHDGSAELGPVISEASNNPHAEGESESEDESESEYEDKKNEKKDKKPRSRRWEYKLADTPLPSYFIFHYAPKDWLQDRGIIRQKVDILTVNLTDDQSQLPQSEAEDVSATCSGMLLNVLQEGSKATDVVPNTTHVGSASLSGSPQVKIEDTASNSPVEQPTGVPNGKDQPKCQRSSSINPRREIEEKTGILAQFMTPPARLSKLSQPATSVRLPTKRERESNPVDVIDVDAISSDDEIVLLDIKPSKSEMTKRARLKYEDEDLKPYLEVTETKPSVSIQQGIDPWRLGC